MKKLIIAFVALEHLLFLILEMFFWNSSIGQKVFKMTPSFAASTTVIAANQGLYNGFLFAGLGWSLFEKNEILKKKLAVFFLSCVVIAGIFGAFTVGYKIFFIQAVPALIGLVLVLSNKKTNS